MKEIIEGYARYRQDVLPQYQPVFEQLKGGQTPQCLLITCSDSRVVLEKALQSEPGEIFVIRNAGNMIADPEQAATSGELGTIEYAVTVLKVPHIIVCGHIGCGAMAGLMAPETLEGLPSVARWVETAQHVREQVLAKCPESTSIEEKNRMAVYENVFAQKARLKQFSPVAQALESKTVRIHGWVFDIASGTIQAWLPQDERFVDLCEWADTVLEPST